MSRKAHRPKENNSTPQSHKQRNTEAVPWKDEKEMDEWQKAVSKFKQEVLPQLDLSQLREAKKMIAPLV